MTRRPAVLVMVNRLPWPINDGFKRRAAETIRALATQADVTIAISESATSEQLRAVPENLNLDVRSVSTRKRRELALLEALFSRLPYHVTQENSREFRSLVRDLARKRFDGVFAISFGMAWIAREHFPTVPILVDSHNIDSEVLARYSASLKSPLERLFAKRTIGQLVTLENEVMRHAFETWVCSPRERDLLKSTRDAVSISVPNGVRTEEFATTRPTVNRQKFVFFGRLDYRPNIDAIDYFVSEIAERVARSGIALNLEIIGAGDTEKVASLVEQFPWIRVTGQVENIATAIGDAVALLVPLRIGGGTRLKILEAMAAGVPVISTSAGAEGLVAQNEVDILLGDTPDEFVAQIERVINDAALRERLRVNAARLVASTYDWDAILSPQFTRFVAYLNQSSQQRQVTSI